MAQIHGVHTQPICGSNFSPFVAFSFLRCQVLNEDKQNFLLRLRGSAVIDGVNGYESGTVFDGTCAYGCHDECVQSYYRTNLDAVANG